MENLQNLISELRDLYTQVRADRTNNRPIERVQTIIRNKVKDQLGRTDLRIPVEVALTEILHDFDGFDSADREAQEQVLGDTEKLLNRIESLIETDNAVTADRIEMPPPPALTADLVEAEMRQVRRQEEEEKRRREAESRRHQPKPPAQDEQRRFEGDRNRRPQQQQSQKPRFDRPNNGPAAPQTTRPQGGPQGPRPQGGPQGPRPQGGPQPVRPQGGAQPPRPQGSQNRPQSGPAPQPAKPQGEGAAPAGEVRDELKFQRDEKNDGQRRRRRGRRH
ncbi:MAG: hypothetical protein KJ042_04080 [Deltaproteobacteria bacterium]|nr:hypothetical protein [Deltaproteobacteria bacterium]